MPDVTLDMLTNIDNHGAFFYRNISYYVSKIDSDQLFSKTKHQSECYKKTHKMLKVILISMLSDF